SRPPAVAPRGRASPSLHDALPIFIEAIHMQPGIMLAKWSCLYAAGASGYQVVRVHPHFRRRVATIKPIPSVPGHLAAVPPLSARSEEHTSELQSRENLVCRLLLEQ